MSDKRDLLFEIGTEELPPKALKKLSEALGLGITDGLKKAGLTFGEVSLYASPRRLAVKIKDLVASQSDQVQERRGPALAAAFDKDGNPTPAVKGFARSCGIEPGELEHLETPKGTWLVFRSTKTGQQTSELLPAIIEKALAGLPIPKRMRWGDSDVEFVRPVHWIVLLLDEEIVPCQILGVTSGRETLGHRFHCSERLSIKNPSVYLELLKSEGKVIADYSVRREMVREQAVNAAQTVGGEVLIDDGLLDEVTALVEWPIAVCGQFDRDFLDVPAEALISSMQDHQKYFPVKDTAGKLLPYFVTISNIESKDPSKVKEGNERVIRPRLSDADFFWNQDRKQPLEAYSSMLDSVVFQVKLGSLREKVQRVSKLAASIAEVLGANVQYAERAALLSKNDLMTQMVGEFPDLQGVMGRYYALHDGEPEAVALALDEQYMPRFAGDRLPSQPIAQALAIADKLDTLVGIFAVGLIPTGDKDPFALRRAALGVLRIIIEQKLDLDLVKLLEISIESVKDKTGDVKENLLTQIYDFMMERLRTYYHDKGVSPDLFDAVLARKPPSPLDFDQRILAILEFRKLPEAESLAAANKRIRNILKKVDGAVPDAVNDGILVEPAEKDLANAVNALSEIVLPLLNEGDYNKAMTHLAGLRAPVDSFFDAVMVMDDDVQLRNNRLALLNQMNTLFLRVADLSRLQS